jgi:hypothetical protein
MRRHFLERFLRDICMLPYLYESQEFQVFVRGKMEIEKEIKMLDQLNTDNYLQRYRTIMPVNEVTNEILIYVFRWLEI